MSELNWATTHHIWVLSTTFIDDKTGVRKFGYRCLKCDSRTTGTPNGKECCKGMKPRYRYLVEAGH